MQLLIKIRLTVNADQDAPTDKLSPIQQGITDKLSEPSSLPSGP